MGLVNKNKSKRGKRQSSRNGKGRKIQSGGSKVANPRIIQMKEQLVSDSVETVLEYADSNNFSVGGSYATWQLRGNSPFDPDYTYTGAQPVGYDQWSSFYSLKKTYKVHVEAQVAPSTKPLVLVIYASPNTTAASSIQAACSQRNSKQVVVGIYKTGKVSLNIDMPDFFGVDAEEYGDYLYGGGVTANPDAVCYVTVQAFNLDATAVNACSMFVKMKMYTQFHSPVYLGISLDKKQEVKPKSLLPPTSQTTGSEVKEGSVKPKRTFKSILSEFDLIDQ